MDMRSKPYKPIVQKNDALASVARREIDKLFICPNCRDNRVGFRYLANEGWRICKSDLYCRKCGQAIDWEGVE